MAAPKSRKAKTGRKNGSGTLGARPNGPTHSKAAGPVEPGSGTAPVAAPEAEPGAGLPSSLAISAHGSAARSGRARLEERIQSHPETGPALTAGDVDADWEAAYSVGDESPGGDNPTPDQGGVDQVGHALGVDYRDDEELRGPDGLADRDRHRWELDPASAEDFTERTHPGATRIQRKPKG